MCSTIPKIVRLSQDVVDRIAAGEVVIRPVNAVKELIENSLDAGATEINVSIRSGGLELIKIQDNGHGINREDLPIVCCRFTTSKLREFEDLQKIQTFGFRGEALASISLISDLTITTKTENEICAFKAYYKDGKIIGQIERSAGLLGTTICIEKLFKNMPSRLAAFRQPNEEANKIADIIVRYSIHYPNVSFSYRRLDGSGFDFRTCGNGDQHSTIKRLLNEKASKELTNIEFKNNSLHFSANICLSKPIPIFTSKAVQSRNDKLKIFHLFVNGRSSFESVFTLRDLICPFASFSLKINSECVDVNIHPTKKIVNFLYEEDIIEYISKQLEKFLNENQNNQSIYLNNNNKEFEIINKKLKKEENNKRKRKAADLIEINGKEKNFQTAKNLLRKENILPINYCSPSASTSSLNISFGTPRSLPKVAPKNKIRVDFLNRSLDEFVLTNDDLNNRPNSEVRLSRLNEKKKKKRKEKEENNKINNYLIEEEEGKIMKNIKLYFTERIKNICQKANNKLIEIFKKHILIGFFDTKHAIIQSNNNIFIINNYLIIKEFFYQLIIFSFGNFGAYDLIQNENNLKKYNISIYELIKLYLKEEEEKNNKIEYLINKLIKNRNMLWNYFSIKIICKYLI
ncbi:hypothetical protein Mgra_00007788 [Meloidogyne graminicola]|uniref:DNA mismatch repair protein S5 domain-containing protein n=1 Tax=Meloidogyne graminicola TaxID=189291 RepID=A0A8S9ZHW4_9BILA|nr:hypothetical protein Mgra_00007788 [Meloidogyne graminicola]